MYIHNDDKHNYITPFRKAKLIVKIFGHYYSIKVPKVIKPMNKILKMGIKLWVHA